MKALYLEEPPLEFGCGRHVDIRRGLIDYGPFDVQEKRRPDVIRIGLVGTPQSTTDVRAWLERVSKGIEAKISRKRNLFQPFPGFTSESAFRSTLHFDDSFLGIIPVREFAKLGGVSDLDKRTDALAALFVDACKNVHDKGADVVVVAYPIELFPLMGEEAEGSESTAPGEEEAEGREERSTVRNLDLHDAIKCRSMLAKVPIQIIRPATCNEKMKRKETDRRGKTRQLQDEATRAWNIMVGIYYKAGGIPWRIPRNESDLDTFYLGIGFYRSLDAETLHTSVAQVFNERGYGVIVRGGQAVRSDTDRQVHLTREAVKELVVRSLKAYRGEHHHAPARVVVHKTSRFNTGEMEGVQDAVSDLSIDHVDMVSLSRSFIRLYRDGYYPPLRGTVLDLDGDRRILYTRGTVPFYEEYPGMYVPRTLLTRFDYVTRPKDEICSEILRLTKMNWNNCQIDELMPITIRAARQVGEILKHAPGGEIAEHYKYYM